MTRRTLLVPLFVAAFILAPSELSGQIESAQTTNTCSQPGEAQG